MSDKKEMWMEDAHSIALDAMKVIEERLKEFGVKLTDAQQDEIYVPLSDRMEEFSNGNYRHEH